jgi:hypothetical protein
MSKHFISLITVLALMSVSGCTTTSNISLEKEESNDRFMKQYQSNISSLNQYSLFSYKVETYEPRLLIGYPGHFEWNGNCLVFVSDDSNKKYTPIFPVQTTKINSDRTSFNVSGINFSVGDEVVLGGSFTKASDNKVSLFTEGNPECLLEETMTII